MKTHILPFRKIWKGTLLDNCEKGVENFTPFALKLLSQWSGIVQTGLTIPSYPLCAKTQIGVREKGGKFKSYVLYETEVRAKIKVRLLPTSDRGKNRPVETHRPSIWPITWNASIPTRVRTRPIWRLLFRTADGKSPVSVTSVGIAIIKPSAQALLKRREIRSKR